MSVRALVALFLLGGGAAFSQPVVSPATSAHDEATEATEATEAKPTVPAAAAASDETVIVGPRTWGEAERSGEYNQPKWSERRRFPETRVYVAPPGSATFEFWAEPKVPLTGEDVRLRTMYEVSFGLGYRLQLDLYLRLEHTGTEPMQVESERVELRWALANWGVLWGNPTLYAEWIRPTAAPQRLEFKLLLGGELSDRLYWGINLFWERELWGGPQESEYGVTGGLSYSLLDSKFSLGAEARLEIVDRRNNRFVPNSVEVFLGPSISFRPLKNAHLLLVCFIGPEVSREDPTAPLVGGMVFQPNLVLGWRF